MPINRLTQSLLLIGAVGALPGCFDSKSKKDDTPPTQFSLAVTDAPVDGARAVVIEFSSVVLQPSDRERIVLRMEEPVRIDLLSLQGQTSQYLLVDKEIPPGDYDWIRLGVNAHLNGEMDSYIELENGSQLELTIPSGAESGLKLTQGFILREGGKADFTIDFDLRRSISMPANNPVASAVLKPTLRMVDTTFAGSIEGEIDELIISEYCDNIDSEDWGAVYVFDHTTTPDDVADGGQGPIASAIVNYTDGSYRYEVGFLPNASYRIAYTCDASADTPVFDEDITFIEPGPEPVTVNLLENLIVDFVQGKGAEEAPKPDPTTPEVPVDEPEAPVDEPEAPVDEPEAPVDEPETPVDETPDDGETGEDPVIDTPDGDPTAPDLDPTVPDLDPTVPDLDPTVPDLDPTVPDLDPTVPDLDPEVPDVDPEVPDTDVPDVDVPDVDVPDLDPVVPDLDPVVPDLDPVVPDLDPVVPDLDPVVPDLDPVEPDLPPEESPPETPEEPVSEVPADKPAKPDTGKPEEPGRPDEAGNPNGPSQPDNKPDQPGRPAESETDTGDGTAAPEQAPEDDVEIMEPAEPDANPQPVTEPTTGEEADPAPEPSEPQPEQEVPQVETPAPDSDEPAPVDAPTAPEAPEQPPAEEIVEDSPGESGNGGGMPEAPGNGKPVEPGSGMPEQPGKSDQDNPKAGGKDKNKDRDSDDENETDEDEIDEEEDGEEEDD